MVGEKLVSVRGLSITFTDRIKGENQVVKGISFDVCKGQSLAIIGESGSGKTVTGLAIAKLLFQARSEVKGSILFDGKEVIQATNLEMSEVRGKDIGMIFQEPMTSLNPLHTIGKQISEVIRLHNKNITNDEVISRVQNLLRQVGMEEFCTRLDHFPHQLSGGQRQRIMIAIAVANNPKLLIADEPTTALDLVNSRKVLELIKKITRELNISLIFITHDLDVVRDIADDICIMKDGIIVESGQAKEILASPKHEYTRFLLNSEPERLIKSKPSTEESLLKVENLVVSYPRKLGFNIFGRDEKKILDNISFEIKRGETLGIIGKSGSGKTTLAMSLLKLIKGKGAITINGQRIDGMKPEALRKFRRHFQIVFQDPYASLNPRFKVADIIAEGPKAQKLLDNDNQIEARVKQVLEEVGLEEKFAVRYPHELSGGQRQRVAIARALIMNPDFIILDEPTSALDKPTQKRVLQLLFDLQQAKKLSYLLISHDYKVISALCHNVAVIEKGVITEYGEVLQMLQKIM